MEWAKGVGERQSNGWRGGEQMGEQRWNWGRPPMATPPSSSRGLWLQLTTHGQAGMWQGQGQGPQVILGGQEYPVHAIPCALKYTGTCGY